MKTKLTIQEKLKDLRVSRHLTLEQLSAETEISKTALGSYETDSLKDIPHTFIATLAEYYGVSADYLLGLSENIKHHDTGIKKLKIDDGMAELLASGRINNRLLCELATHPDFPKLLTDLEIYVDGLINIQMQTLNAALDSARQRLSDLFHPDENDYYMKLLKAARIDDDGYFLNIIQNDLKAIIADIRKNHKKDVENADDVNISDKINEVIDDINNYNGNLLDLLTYYFCREIKLPLHEMSSEEIQTIHALFQRSGRYKAELRHFHKGRKK